MDNDSSDLLIPQDLVRSLDIGQVSFTDSGIDSFFWPLDNRKTTELMDSLTAVLIPFITSNQNQFTELVACRLLFKWLIIEILRLYEATVISSECVKQRVTPIIPEHYKKLRALYNAEQIESDFFKNLHSGPSYGRKIPRVLKRLAKEVLWNGFDHRLLRKFGSNAEDVLAFAPSALAIKHARGKKRLLRYSGFDEWFRPITESPASVSLSTAACLDKIVNIVEEKFRDFGYSLSREASAYLSNWLCQADQFVSYHLQDVDARLDRIGSEVWFGCGGSTVWHTIFIEKLRRRGIKVVTHDHGSGNSHHEQTPVHWVEFMHTDQFVTFNRVNEENRNSQFRQELIFGQNVPKILSIDRLLGNVESEEPPTALRAGRIKKVMYVGTAFHGEGARLRPIFHDMTYFDWQIKLLAHLKSLNLDVIYKPHPEGATIVPGGFAESFGFTTSTKNFETVRETVDAYIIDFLFSSTTPAVLKKGKPVFFINLGYPALIPEALALVKKSLYYFEAKYSDDSRLSIDFDEFDSCLSRAEHVYDLSFADIYFKNA